MLAFLSQALQRKYQVVEGREQREKVRSGFGSQLHPYILNKTWFFSCDRILKQAIYVPGFSTSQNRVAPLKVFIFHLVRVNKLSIR